MGAANEEIGVTKQFFFNVIPRCGGIHYSRISDNLLLGSTPKCSAHVSSMKNSGVTAVLTLQTGPDLLTHCKYANSQFEDINNKQFFGNYKHLIALINPL